MWSFKKKPRALELATPKEEEITLLPEELPVLELPKTEAVRSAKIEKIVVAEKFLKMDKLKGIIGEINTLSNDLDSVDLGVSKAIDIKDLRNERIGLLQNNLEDISRKLMTIENMLFGG